MTRGTLRRAFGRNRESVVEIPDGTSFDLATMLWENNKVRVWTVDGITVTVERLPSTTVDYNRNLIRGVRITTEFAGDRKVIENGWCQRYLTVWESVDSQREGLRWRFGDRDGEIFNAAGVCARSIYGL